MQPCRQVDWWVQLSVAEYCYVIQILLSLKEEGGITVKIKKEEGSIRRELFIA